MLEDINNWFSNAYDYTFGGSTPETPDISGWESNDGWDYDFKNKPEAYADFSSDLADNSLDLNWSGYEGQVPGNIPGQNNNGSSFTKALLSPSVLGAIVTSGAGLLGGLSSLSAQQEQLKAAKEQQKMNQMLELAKLKYQLMGKGGGGSRRSGSSGGANRGEQVNAQYSANQASGYAQLGNNLSSIYR